MSTTKRYAIIIGAYLLAFVIALIAVVVRATVVTIISMLLFRTTPPEILGVIATQVIWLSVMAGTTVLLWLRGLLTFGGTSAPGITPQHS